MTKIMSDLDLDIAVVRLLGGVDGVGQEGGNEHCNTKMSTDTFHTQSSYHACSVCRSG